MMEHIPVGLLVVCVGHDPLTYFCPQMLHVAHQITVLSSSRSQVWNLSPLRSGITIYVLQAGPQGMSASLSIDSGTASTATLAAPPAPQYNIPHVTLFSVQGLVSGTHSAEMTVLDWDGGISGMMLDYIDVNEAVVSATSTSPTTSSTPTTTYAQTSTSASTSTTNGNTQSSQSTTSQSTQSSLTTSSVSIVSSLTNQTSTTAAAAAPTSSTATGGSNDTSSSSGSTKNNIGAVAGGVVAGVVSFLGLCALAFFCFRRRRARAKKGRATPLLNDRPDSRFIMGPGPDPFARGPTLPTSPSISTFAAPPARSRRGIDTAISNAVEPAISPRSHLTSTTTSDLSDEHPTQGSIVDISPNSAGVDYRQEPSLLAMPVSPPTPTVWPNEKAPLSQDVGQGPAAVSSSRSADQPVLTDEQADFVTSLYQNNVPVPVVARVLQRMLANPNPSPRGAGPSSAIGAYDPELQPYINAGAATGQFIPPASYTDRMPWTRSGVSDFGDGETTIGTAPPSYDYARAQS
ncbi:hypothetical protein ID866_4294 [Astraeus odoratus]|nr:hypothetical protein ID866_4294 [Astraeus odoratus]